MDGVELAGCRGVVADVLGRHRHRGVPEERRAPGGHLEQHHAQGVDVATGIDPDTLGLLGGEVGGRAHHRSGLGQALLGVDGPGDAEVGHLHLAVVGDQHIAGLDVAVDDPVLVGVTQGRGHMGPDVRRPLGGQRSGTLQYGGQGPAIDELHDDEVGAGVFAPVEDGDDVGMGQVGCGLGLAAEPLDERPVDRQLGEQDLEGHRTVEQPITGAVDLGHAAPGDQVVELVALREDTRRLGRVHVGQSLGLRSLGIGVLMVPRSGLLIGSIGVVTTGRPVRRRGSP